MKVTKILFAILLFVLTSCFLQALVVGGQEVDLRLLMSRVLPDAQDQVDTLKERMKQFMITSYIDTLGRPKVMVNLRRIKKVSPVLRSLEGNLLVLQNIGNEVATLITRLLHDPPGHVVTYQDKSIMPSVAVAVEFAKPTFDIQELKGEEKRIILLLANIDALIHNLITLNTLWFRQEESVLPRAIQKYSDNIAVLGRCKEIVAANKNYLEYYLPKAKAGNPSLADKPLQQQPSTLKKWGRQELSASPKDDGSTTPDSGVTDMSRSSRSNTSTPEGQDTRRGSSVSPPNVGGLKRWGGLGNLTEDSES